MKNNREDLPFINMLSEGTIINGDITVEQNIRIDCKVFGNIICGGNLIVSITGYVEGNIECKNAEISGEIKGNLKSSELTTLKETSKITGDISTTKLIVDNGAIVSIKCNADNSECK